MHGHRPLGATPRGSSATRASPPGEPLSCGPRVQRHLEGARAPVPVLQPVRCPGREDAPLAPQRAQRVRRLPAWPRRLLDFQVVTHSDGGRLRPAGPAVVARRRLALLPLAGSMPVQSLERVFN